jgi:hypothetical protein
MSNLNFDNNIVQSILTIKASEISHSEAMQDLDLPEGKTIAELLNDQKNPIQDKEDNTTIE